MLRYQFNPLSTTRPTC